MRNIDHSVRFVRPEADKQEEVAWLYELMEEYVGELDSHHNRQTPIEIVRKVTDSMLHMQSDPSRHLEIGVIDDVPIGFFYGKIDRPDHKGLIRPGWGYIMEFYIRPNGRRNGYGRCLYERLESCLCADGATAFYLTSDPVTGKPFWEAMGYVDSGEISPENQLSIYEKKINVCSMIE